MLNDMMLRLHTNLIIYFVQLSGSSAMGL